MGDPSDHGVSGPTAPAEDAWWDAVYGPEEREPAHRGSTGTVDDWFATALGAIGEPDGSFLPEPEDGPVPSAPQARIAPDHLPPPPRVPDPRVVAPRAEPTPPPALPTPPDLGAPSLRPSLGPDPSEDANPDAIPDLDADLELYQDFAPDPPRRAPGAAAAALADLFGVAAENPWDAPAAEPEAPAVPARPEGATVPRPAQRGPETPPVADPAPEANPAWPGVSSQASAPFGEPQAPIAAPSPESVADPAASGQLSEGPADTVDLSKGATSASSAGSAAPPPGAFDLPPLPRRGAPATRRSPGAEGEPADSVSRKAADAGEGAGAADGSGVGSGVGGQAGPDGGAGLDAPGEVVPDRGAAAVQEPGERVGHDPAVEPDSAADPDVAPAVEPGSAADSGAASASVPGAGRAPRAQTPTPTLPDGAALRWGRARPGVPAGAPEPDALPEADPAQLDALVPDTVLELARHGSMTLRAASARGEDARAVGAPRGDRLVVARFGDGADGLLVAVVAAGPGAGDAARRLGEAVGQSRAALLADLRQGAQEQLRFGLQRLTARAARVLGPQATLHAVLAPLDPTNRLRAGFGTGPGALLLLGDDAWYDAYAGRRLTAAQPEAEPAGAAQPGRFRFRAVVPESGDVLLLCTDGLAEPLRAEPAIAALLAEHWSQPHAPAGVDFLRQIQARASGHSGDRTAVAIWQE